MYSIKYTNFWNLQILHIDLDDFNYVLTWITEFRIFPTSLILQIWFFFLFFLFAFISLYIVLKWKLFSWREKRWRKLDNFKRVSDFRIRLVLCVSDSYICFGCSDNESAKVNLHYGSVMKKKANNIIYRGVFKKFFLHSLKTFLIKY